MGNELTTLLAQRVSDGLRRKTATSCSKWAEMYRVMGSPFAGPWSFDHHPWTKEMHDCEAEMVVGQKAAQMGFTEWALNKTFKAIDIHGTSCLYVLPANNPDATDFSTARFDPALEGSPHLSTLFTDVKNIHHKRAGHANLYIRGSRSRSQLKSVPVGLLVFDELDEMVQENISLALERMSGQLEKQALALSTPTIDNYGINQYYRKSSENHFFFRCPHCSKLTELIFPECLVITSDDPDSVEIRDTYLQCKECQGRLEHDSKIDWLREAQWVQGHTDRIVEGYHINQLYSMTVKPYEIAVLYLRAQSNPTDEQEFYNSKLGITHIVEGARITDADIEKCTGTHIKMSQSPGGMLVMGIDVGKWLHYEIDQVFIDREAATSDINLATTIRLVTEGKVQNFEELDLLVSQFGVSFAVIDANPERRKALEFAQRFWGHVKLCFYGTGINSKSIHIHAEEEHTMSVDRTSWIDLAMSRFRREKMVLPRDLSTEYKNHLKAPVRIYTKDVSGNPVGKYVTGNEDDHFAHSRTYAELAIQLAVGLARVEDINGVV